MDLLMPFDIIHNEEELHVVPKKIGVDIIYMIHFPSGRPPIMLTKATKQGIQTSVGNAFRIERIRRISAWLYASQNLHTKWESIPLYQGIGLDLSAGMLAYFFFFAA
jgi:hypothetical protein